MKYTKTQENEIKTGYDLENSDYRKTIKEFEVLLEQLKTAPLKNSLEYYGEPKQIIKAFKMGGREFPESQNSRRVYNNVTGLTDAGIVQHLLETRAISRRYVKANMSGAYWAVGPNLKAYEDWCEKRTALDELRYLRTCAEGHEAESFEALVEDREVLINSMKI
jgi:hypothetical protein